ncbi:hypothetical protein A2U01_0073670, partial [Trifolium medium]|nr:hypothetical protein [Trifolium medium]
MNGIAYLDALAHKRFGRRLRNGSTMRSIRLKSMD